MQFAKASFTTSVITLISYGYARSLLIIQSVRSRVQNQTM